jgi:hypothetical protein
MDAFGTAVNALYLVEKVVKYLKDVKGFNEDQYNLILEASGLQMMLTMLRDRSQQIQNATASQSSNDPWISAISSLGTPNGPLFQCEEALKAVESSLRPAVGAQKLGQQLLWPFKKGEVAAHIGRIERLKTLISLTFQTSLSFVRRLSAFSIS